MTRAESLEAETMWTSGQAAARRKALTDAGMERPVAEVLVDLLDEQAAPMMTRAEADARFTAMLDRLDAQRAQDRAETDARFAQIDARFMELKGELDTRFGAIDARFAQIDARFMELKGELDTRFGAIDARFAQVDARFAELKGEMDARFGSIDARFGSVDGQMTGLAGQVAGLSGQLSTLKWTFGSIMAFNTLLLGVLTYTVAS